MKLPAFILHASSLPRAPGWRDALLFAAFFALVFGVMQLVWQMRAPFVATQVASIDLSPWRLPGYAARSLLRMYLAFGASLAFSLAYGWIAAHNASARRYMLPLLDVLQSVPVLGFLSVTVTGFMALFPGSILGLECASIFAIFTGQAWNMTFSFYQSLRVIPQELVEASAVYRLTRWQRFLRLEVPYGMIGLVWNSMMSFGGGWFFLAASEAISVLGQSYKLPGIGSYMAEAVEAGDMTAVGWSILTMITVVVVIDQLFWRPIVAWSQKFKFEQTAGGEPTSWLLDLVQQSALPDWLNARLGHPLGRLLDRFFAAAESGVERLPSASGRLLGRLLGLVCAAVTLYGAWHMVEVAVGGVNASELAHVLWLGTLTLLRVIVMLGVATLVWTPIGVHIGLSPRLARVAQPFVQIGASFPANLLFPIVVVWFLRLRISLDWGSILLMALGTQWYVLFNVIGGASAMPSDLREAASVFGLRRLTWWRVLILPAIFPFWVTGALTAAGGAWNASIVAEVASWGTQHLEAHGLGAYIAAATANGDWPRIILGIAVMSAFVVLTNRLVWRPLYEIAERKYRLG